jgi:predicted transcriptional regulator
MVTSIQLDDKTKAKLEKMKMFPREPYNNVVTRLMKIAEDDDLIDTKTIKDLEDALADVKNGRLLSHKQVKHKHGL